jgi:hypothetical protein
LPNAKYLVNVHQKNSDGSFELLESKSTDLSYARLNLNLLSQEDVFYNITALNKTSDAIILEGDRVKPVPPGWNPFDLTCWIDCVGKSYAWRLYLGQQDNGNWSITDPGKVFLTSASAYVDYSNYIVIPYWQAISTSVYDAIPSGHPYKTVTDYIFGQPVYLYKRQHINSTTPGGPFYDRQGSLVTSGYLIEKKMDEYKWMESHHTNLINPSATFCDMNINGWRNTFNTNLDQTNLQTPPLSTPFSYTVPTILGCDNAIGVAANPDDFLPPTEPYNYNDLVWCWTNSGNLVPSDLVSAIECVQLLTWTTGVEITQLDNAMNPISWRFDGANQQSIVDQLKNLSVGLYRVMVFTTDGNVIPLIFEQKLDNVNVIRQHKDFVKLEISPNQIQNEVLKIKIISDKNMHATIKVHSLSGIQLHTESVQLSKTSDLMREIPVAAIDYPYNQILVTIAFDDNSSIQGTAIR